MQKKITKHIDRIVMGAIIGAAVGSVLGLKFAKKKPSVDGENSSSINESLEPSKKRSLLRKIFLGK